MVRSRCRATVAGLLVLTTVLACADSEIRRTARENRATLSVEEWGAPWTRRITIIVAGDGVVIGTSKSSTDVMIRRHHALTAASKQELALNIADLLEAASPATTARTDPARLRVRIVSRDRSWERRLAAPYGGEAVTAIENINRFLPAEAKLSHD